MLLFEVCNSKYLCDNTATPYALNGDGSTNDFGICEENTICRCLTTAQCSVEEVVLFTAVNGSPYADQLDNSQLVFSQTSTDSPGIPESLVITNPNAQFCNLQMRYFDRLSNGACIFANPLNITLNEAVICVRKNPCVSGLLAFKPNDPDSFVLNASNLNVLNTVPLGCVLGELTPTGITAQCMLTYQVPMFNKNTGQIECISTL